jgi:hypothetical protein
MYNRMNRRAVPETRRVTANLPVKLVDDACQVTGKGITETLVAGLGAGETLGCGRQGARAQGEAPSDDRYRDLS